ncbi:MAG: hypothetical protein E6K29_17900 [Gammaproteobacteria bacterium]|nr:MAG: hypothetical protein E6K29_17900 [Gammaproteobacteria bacterium]
MKKNDNGLRELLELLKTHPELIKELVFDSKNIQSLLKGKAARQLALGVDARKFLAYVAGPEDGYPIALCSGGTKWLCAKGTRVVVCSGGTKPY